MLCETCTDLLRTLGEASTESESIYEEPSVIERSFKHHATYNAFKRALDIGCALCKKFWVQISDEAVKIDDELPAFELELRWYIYRYGCKSDLHLRIYLVRGFCGVFSIPLTQVDFSEGIPHLFPNASQPDVCVHDTY